MCGDVLTDEPLRRHELLIGRPQEMVAILKVVQIKQAADVVTDDTLIDAEQYDLMQSRHLTISN